MTTAVSALKPGTRERALYVKNCVRRGTSMAEVGRRLGLSRTRVYQICHRPMPYTVPVGRPGEKLHHSGDWLRQLGMNVRRHRKMVAKMSLMTVSSKAGTNASTLSCFERGYRRMPMNLFLTVLGVIGANVDDVWPAGVSKDKLAGVGSGRPAKGEKDWAGYDRN